jgi:hypothetical protein
MKRSVYFHIDEIARDAVVAANLRKILSNAGVELVYGNRAHTHLFGVLNNFSAFDLYVFPNMDLFKSECPDVKRVTAPVVILPTETVGGTARNVDRLAAKYFGSYPDECWPWINAVAAFCVWGPSHRKAFEAKGPQLLPKCHVVGHPRFDRRCQAETSATTAHGRIRVGIISRFFAINPFDQRGMLQVIYEGRKIPGREQPIYRMSPNRDVEDRIYTEAIDLRLIFGLIDRLDPNRYQIVLRTHPREDRTTWERLIAHNRLPVELAPWDQPYIHWVNGVDHVVGPVSTSFYDCMVAGKTPVCTVDIAPHRENHILIGGDDENPILKYVQRPRSMDELVQLVSEKPKLESSKFADGLLEILYQEANYPECSNSLDYFARVCLDVLQSSQSRRPARRSARLKHDVVTMAHGLASNVFRRGKPEQSASFVLSAKRKRWINNLAFS